MELGFSEAQWVIQASKQEALLSFLAHLTTLVG